jgi:hypothetical protein
MGNDFLFSGNWFDRKYSQLSSGRYTTFKTALNLIHQGRLGGNGEIVIVETGTTRLPNDWGAGMSTVLFGDYLKRYGGLLYTVDIEAKNIETCREVTKEFENNIEYVVSDSHDFLRDFKKGIDLLYLDSMDYPLKKEEGPVEDCQKHQLKEYELAKAKLKSGWSVVLLDDNELRDGGKCKLTKQQLLKDMAVHVMDAQQSLWLNL